MGQMGEQLGLCVYLGAEGYHHYDALVSGELNPGDPASGVDARAVAVLFVDRADMPPEDIAVIRRLGLRFRGRGVWPMFTSIWHGYLPWMLHPEEVVQLTTALEQICAVSEDVRANPSSLTPPDMQAPILTRRFAAGAWSTVWSAPPGPPIETPEAPLDPAALTELRRAAKVGRQTWEIDVVQLPSATAEGDGRPYYPQAILAVATTGLIAGIELMTPWATLDERRLVVARMLTAAPLMPRRLRVQSAAGASLIGPVAEALGLSVEREPVVQLADAYEALVADFMQMG